MGPLYFGTNMQNSWPDNHRHAMYQYEHESWNAKNYPGTLQLCAICEEPTGRCEEDALLSYSGPLCEECYGIQKELMG